MKLVDLYAIVLDMIGSYRKCHPHNCSAPVIYLVGEILLKKSYDVDQFMCKMKTAFRLSGKNRWIYVDFLSEAGVQNSKPLHIPVITRWFSRLEAIIHYKEYFDHYPTKMKTIQNNFGDAAGGGELLQLLINVEKYKAMKWQLRWKNYKIFENGCIICNGESVRNFF